MVIKEIEERATEGEWMIMSTFPTGAVTIGTDDGLHITQVSIKADAEYIIALRNEFRSLQAERDKYREALLTITIRAYAKRGRADLSDELSGIAQSALREE